MVYRPRYLDAKRQKRKPKIVGVLLTGNKPGIRFLCDNGDTVDITGEKIEHHDLGKGTKSGWYSSGKIF